MPEQHNQTHTHVQKSAQDLTNGVNGNNPKRSRRGALQRAKEGPQTFLYSTSTTSMWPCRSAQSMTKNATVAMLLNIPRNSPSPGAGGVVAVLLAILGWGTALSLRPAKVSVSEFPCWC